MCLRKVRGGGQKVEEQAGRCEHKSLGSEAGLTSLKMEQKTIQIEMLVKFGVLWDLQVEFSVFVALD